MSNQPGPWGQQPGQGQPPQNQPPQNQPPQNQPQWAPQGGQPSYGQRQPSYGQGQPAYGQGQPGGWGQPGQPQQGYGPYQGGGGYQPGGPGGGKKSPALIIGIVVVAVVLIAAVGGIVMALGRGGSDPVSTVTPGQQSAPPTTDPSADPSGDPSSEPSDPSSEPSDPATEDPSSDPSESDPPSGGGSSYQLANGITLTAADGWTAETEKSAYVVLSSSTGEIFEGQSLELKTSSDPKQVVDAWHEQLAEKMSDVKNGETRAADVGDSGLNAATGAMAGTLATSQGSLYVITESVVSVRKSDGVTVIATMRYFKESDTDELKVAYRTMANSMLSSQAKG